MATSLLSYQPSSHPIYHPIKSPKTLTPRINTKFQYPVTIPITKHKCFFSSNVVALSSVSNRSTSRNGDNEEKDVELVNVLRKWLSFVHSALPGGSWWNLNECKEVSSTAKPITVLGFLLRMWSLVVDDKWIVFIAFGSLIIAALLEISIPNLLATSIFSAESGETSVFLKNAYLMALLCITSGIFSGLRSGFFATVNVNLVTPLQLQMF